MMPDYFIRFIPENLNSELTACEIKQIKEIHTYGSINVREAKKIEFADAGQNFDSLSCPHCDSSLEMIGWWTTAMTRAYEQDFMELDVISPCCNKKASLHHLNYYFNQGFYRTIVELERKPELWEIPDVETAKMMSEDLLRITGFEWRVIYVRV